MYTEMKIRKKIKGGPDRGVRQGVDPREPRRQAGLQQAQEDDELAEAQVTAFR